MPKLETQKDANADYEQTFPELALQPQTAQ